MAEDQEKKGSEGERPEEKSASSGDTSGRGRPRRDDHVLPQGGGRSEFGTHGGPNGKGNHRKVPSQSEGE